jgi:hypothetical protein
MTNLPALSMVARMPGQYHQRVRETQYMRTPVAATALLVTTAVLAAPAPAGATEPGERRVGSLVLERCEQGTRWWCGSLRRPLDPARPGGGGSP